MTWFKQDLIPKHFVRPTKNLNIKLGVHIVCAPNGSFDSHTFSILCGDVFHIIKLTSFLVSMFNLIKKKFRKKNHFRKDNSNNVQLRNWSHTQIKIMKKLISSIHVLQKFNWGHNLSFQIYRTWSFKHMKV